jgi:hypothetical protein
VPKRQLDGGLESCRTAIADSRSTCRAVQSRQESFPNGEKNFADAPILPNGAQNQPIGRQGMAMRKSVERIEPIVVEMLAAVWSRGPQADTRMYMTSPVERPVPPDSNAVTADCHHSASWAEGMTFSFSPAIRCLGTCLAARGGLPF